MNGRTICPDKFNLSVLFFLHEIIKKRKDFYPVSDVFPGRKR